jgi:hypothetical protein
VQWRGRDNAFLLVHGLSGNPHAFGAMIGPHKTFDTEKNFVITVDAIGGWRQLDGAFVGLERGSTPRDGAQPYPDRAKREGRAQFPIRRRSDDLGRRARSELAGRPLHA